MARHDEPVRAAGRKRPDAGRRSREPQAPTQYARCPGAAAQLAAVHRTLRQGPVLQLQAGGAAAGGRPAAAAPAAPANRTGLPGRLKRGIEALSGLSLDDVRVHRNSARPAQLQALAYTQGSDIHVAPGQEAHLPHEAWHVVQQKQGRVRPTLQMKGVEINDDAALEREADLMGARASTAEEAFLPLGDGNARPRTVGPASGPLQRRAPGKNDVPGGTLAGTADIFDSRVTTGKLFGMTVPVKNNDAATVIKAYHSAITPVGNAVANTTFLDTGVAKFSNPVAAMPVLAPVNVLNYLMTTVVGVGTIGFRLDVANDSAMSKLFGDDLDWTRVKFKLASWFQTRDLLLDNKYVGLLDPLVLRITFQSQTAQQGDWEVDTQFAESGRGYIVRIKDGKNNVSGQILTNPAFILAAGAATANADDYIYSSTHVGGGPAAVAGMGPGAVPLGTRVDALRGAQNPDTRGAQHDALDAFTLAAAEGARFRPVGELGGAAHLWANFFTKPGPAFKNAHNVTLQWLYLNWGGLFGSAYDITKETMATVVDAQGAAITKKPAKPNYNLTTGVMDKS